MAIAGGDVEKRIKGVIKEKSLLGSLAHPNFLK